MIEWVKEMECDGQTHADTHTHIPLDYLQGEGMNDTFTTNLPPKCASTTLTRHYGAINNKNFINFQHRSEAAKLERLNYEWCTQHTLLWNQVRSGLGTTNSTGSQYELRSFVLVVSVPLGLAWAGQQRDGQLIKQAGNGLHEKLIRVLMKANWAGPARHW